LEETNKFLDILPYLKEQINLFPDIYPIYENIASFYSFSLFDHQTAMSFYEIAAQLARKPNHDFIELSGFCEYNLNISHDYMLTAIQDNDLQNAKKIILDFYKSGLDDYAQYEDNLVYFYLETNQLWEAKCLLEKQIKQKEPNHDNLGTYYYVSLEISKSDEVFEKLSNLYEQYKPLRSISELYGMALLLYKEFAQAETIFFDLVRRLPIYDGYRENYAYCLLRLGKYVEAIREYERLIMHSPYNGEYRWGLGLCYAEHVSIQKGREMILEAQENMHFYKVNEYIKQQCEKVISNN
jgi:tetratricopeptide (TPR) repeat protein